MMRISSNSPTAPADRPDPDSENPMIAAIRDLVEHARILELLMADEVLTDILAQLHGEPIEDLDRL
ncbi:MAG TPA: hypothetical protein VIL69_25025, partial [Roseomonas sp.]